MLLQKLALKRFLIVLLDLLEHFLADQAWARLLEDIKPSGAKLGQPICPSQGERAQPNWQSCLLGLQLPSDA